MNNANMISSAEIMHNLKTKFIGRKIHFLKDVTSTNDVAKRLAFEGAEEGSVVIAGSQLNGKGRGGREWFSPLGGIWLSIILRPKSGFSNAALITLMAGIAVARVISRITKLKAALKWPNDVIINGKKVCGILAEMSGPFENRFLVLGIGINANIDSNTFPIELKVVATTLRSELRYDVNKVELIRLALEELEGLYLQLTQNSQGGKVILTEWKKLTNTIGAYVTFVTGDEIFKGQAVDVDEDGALILKLENGSFKKFYSGDVSINY
ncbi:MAG: biotin--[acetyl-CoA-carboxylase] ligase [Candidatus Bathyarchaeota archaeon]